MWNWLTAIFCSRDCSRQSSGTSSRTCGVGDDQPGSPTRRRIEEQGFGEAAFFFGNGGEPLELLSVDDGEVESGFGAVIEEDGIDDFARGGRQAERDIGDAEDRS